MSGFRDDNKIKQLQAKLDKAKKDLVMSGDKKGKQKIIDDIQAEIDAEKAKPSGKDNSNNSNLNSTMSGDTKTSGVNTDPKYKHDTGNGTKQTDDRSFNADEQVKTLEKGEQNRKSAEQVLKEKGQLKGKKWADILSTGLFAVGNGLKTAVGGEADELPDELKGQYDKYKGTSKQKINEQEDKKQALYDKQVEDYGNQVKENRDLDTVVNTLNISQDHAKELLKFTEELGIASAEDYGRLEQEQKEEMVRRVVNKRNGEPITSDDWAKAEMFLNGLTGFNQKVNTGRNVVGGVGDAINVVKSIVPGK